MKKVKELVFIAIAYVSELFGSKKVKVNKN